MGEATTVTELPEDSRSTWITPLALMAQSALAGALLVGAVLLTVVALLGGQLAQVVHLSPLPYALRFLFAHPVLFPAIAAMMGIALMVAMHQLIRDRVRALLA